MLLDLSKKGYQIVQLASDSIVYEIKDMLAQQEDGLLNASDTEFHERLKTLQKNINMANTRNILVKELAKYLIDFHKSPVFGAQTVIYLRGVRPCNKQRPLVEQLPFHRENFYCDSYIDHQLNMHFPLNNYNENTAMRIIEGSHQIPDTALQIKKLDSNASGVKRFSVGHSLGLPYNPKIIDNLDTLGRQERLKAAIGTACLFSSKLLHGGGVNISDKIRFSLDFATLPKEYMGEQKQFHYASNSKDSKAHFEMVNISTLVA